MEQLKRTGRAVVQSSGVFVFTAVVLVRWSESQPGHLNPAGLFDAAKVAVLAAVSTVVGSFPHRKR